MKLLPLSLPFPHLAAPSNGESHFPGFHSLWSETMMENTFLNHNPFPTLNITSSSTLLRIPPKAFSAPQAPLQKCPCTGGCPPGLCSPNGADVSSPRSLACESDGAEQKVCAQPEKYHDIQCRG